MGKVFFLSILAIMFSVSAYASDISYWTEDVVGGCQVVKVRNDSSRTRYRIWIRYYNTRNTSPVSDGSEEGGWWLAPGGNGNGTPVCESVMGRGKGFSFNYRVRWEPIP